MAEIVSPRLESLVLFSQQHTKSLEFFQLMRLMFVAMRQDLSDQGLTSDQLADWDSLFRTYIRVRPRLSLSFPESDVSSVRLNKWRQVEVETNFFGLYGVTSPLPHFYTEDLIDAEQNGCNAIRRFVDIFHYASYPLLVKAWSRNRLASGLEPLSHSRHVLRDTSWLGLMEPKLRQRFDQWRKMLPLAPILSSTSRSASGLQFLVARIVGSGVVSIVPCYQARRRIPVIHSLRVGIQNNVIGSSATLGSIMVDHANNVLINISDIQSSVARSIVPGGVRFRLLQQGVMLFLKSSLRVTIKIQALPEKSFVGKSQVGLGAGIYGHQKFDSFVFHLIR